MRLLIVFIVVVYFVGVGVVLAPTIQSKWTTEPASLLASSVIEALPVALAWPARALRSISGGERQAEETAK